MTKPPLDLYSTVAASALDSVDMVKGKVSDFREYKLPDLTIREGDDVTFVEMKTSPTARLVNIEPEFQSCGPLSGAEIEVEGRLWPDIDFSIIEKRLIDFYEQDVFRKLYLCEWPYDTAMKALEPLDLDTSFKKIRKLIEELDDEGGTS